MKQASTFLTLLISLMLNPSLSSQNAPWASFFSDPGPQFATDIIQTSEGGYIISAYSSPVNAASFYIVKMDSAGDLDWEINISKDNYSSRAYSIIEAANNCYVAIGSATMQRRPWIVKFNHNGDTLWTSHWTDNLPANSALAARGTILNDGRIVVTGAQGALGLQPNMFLVSQNGALLEQRLLNAPVPPVWYGGTSVSHIERTSDGGFVLTGSAGSGSSSKVFLWKFDMNADSTWSVLYSDSSVGMRAAASVKQLSNGDYILAGFNSPNGEHTCVMRTTASGEVIWFNTYPDASSLTQATDIIGWHDEQILVTEKRFAAAGQNIFESALLKIDANGNLLSRDIITSGDASVAILRMRKTSDGGFVMAGEINETGIMNDQDLFVLKSDAAGDISSPYFEVLLNTPGSKNMPAKQHAVEILPNPAGMHNNIRVRSKAEIRRIELFTLTGNLISEYNTPGLRNVEINAPEKSGMYLVVTHAANGAITTSRLIVH
jgi:hypothetical protein